MSTRKAVFYTFAFFLFVLIVPQLCAQNEPPISQSEAAILRQKLVDYSKQFIGKPYVAGGTGPNSFDCSGLIFTVSREAISWQLPRTTKAIFSYAKDIDDSSREAGDLVFFKTTSSGEVSHVGLYIGNNQFIHAASDGPNTGVIISSLKESYWKVHYFCTRRYIPASNSELLADSKPKSNQQKNSGANGGNATSSSNNGASGDTKSVCSGGDTFRQTTVSSSNGATGYSTNDTFLSSLIVDASLSFDWSFFTPESFRLNFRGFDTLLHVRYEGKTLQPGFGTYFRYDAGTDNLQLPLVISLTLNEFVRIFAGPVISIGTPTLPDDSDYEIKNSFFPGILGISFSTPSLQVGKTFLSLVQDIHFTVFNDTDGSALSFTKNIPTGLVFATGLRVTLPLRDVL